MAEVGEGEISRRKKCIRISSRSPSGRWGHFFIWLASFTLVAAWTQTPEIEKCPSEQKFRLSDVTVEDATIGRTMTVNFTLTVTEELADEPKLEVTVIKQNGRKVSCPPRGGACVYRLCGGTSNEEKFLGQLWNNECPVPVTERRESTSARLNPMIQMVIGRAPTTITVEYKVKNGGATVGCQSFQVRIDAP